MTEASTKSRFVAAVERSAAAGEFTPDTRRNMKCARCGGQMVIFKWFTFDKLKPGGKS